MNTPQQSESVSQRCMSYLSPMSPIYIYTVAYGFPPFRRSREWTCPRCHTTNLEHLPDPSPSDGSASSSSSSETSSAETSTSAPSPAPAFESSDNVVVTIEAPPEVSVAPEENVQSQAQEPPLQMPVVHRPIPLIAPKPTRPHTQASIVIQSYTPPRTPDTQPASRRDTPQPALVAAVRQTPRRPPVLLDTAICVILVLMFALVARRFL